MHFVDYINSLDWLLSLPTGKLQRWNKLYVVFSFHFLCGLFIWELMVIWLFYSTIKLHKQNLIIWQWVMFFFFCLLYKIALSIWQTLASRRWQLVEQLNFCLKGHNLVVWLNLFTHNLIQDNSWILIKLKTSRFS